MDKEFFKEEIKAIQYSNGKPTVFQILYYEIK